jgi:hypothetical protein
MSKTIEERLAALEAAVATLQGAAASSQPVDLASDKYADFSIRRCPPSWLDSGGPDYTGSTISQTTPEFCDAIASYLDWTAAKDEAKNYSYVNGKGETVFPAKYARKDAARARAWAARLRGGPVMASRPRPAAVASNDDFGGTTDELPF